MDRGRVSGERRLMLVIGAVVFADTMFYAAIAPLLPELAHSLHLSKLSAGVLAASYPIGTLVAALPSGILASRIGLRGPRPAGGLEGMRQIGTALRDRKLLAGIWLVASLQWRRARSAC